jgi:hypothetical protein
MSTSHAVCPLTADERHLLALLRQGPQSIPGVAETLRLGLEHTCSSGSTRKWASYASSATTPSAMGWRSRPGVDAEHGRSTPPIPLGEPPSAVVL